MGKITPAVGSRAAGAIEAPRFPTIVSTQLERARRYVEALVHHELRTAQVPRDDLAHRVQLDKRVRDAIDELERAHRSKRAADVAVAILDRQLQTVSRVVTIRRAELEHLPTPHRPLHR